MKSYIQVELGKRVRFFRKIKGYSQEEFAEKIGIATNTLSSIETGNAFMTAVTLEKISDILNVRPKELFSFETESEEYMYDFVKNHLELVKTNSERLKVIYNFVKNIV
ncbi:helix-turn-helix transcriptional regulator [bacterium]|nr:helix-turn-helix transcriptional regulator [bacterium]